tara:strand:- start:199 stop:1371 length:1173 start_codon:yes stop_codon:yes gene_type:complete
MAIEYTSISEVINDFQLMVDDGSYGKEASLYQIRLLALQGLRELTFDVEQTVRTTTMSVDSTTLQVTLPNDFVKAVKIGFKGSDGDIHPLGLSSKLALDETVSPTSSVDVTDEVEPYYHTDLGRRFGIGGGNNINGYYRINREDNTINFSSDVSGRTIFLEYISDGITETPPKDHIIRFNMNNGLDRNGVQDGTTIKIPISGSTVTYTFKNEGKTPIANLTVDPSATDIYVVTDDATSEDIAEALSTVINEGHPSYHVGPNNTNVKASHIGNQVVVTVSKLTSAVTDLMDSTFDSNVDTTTNHSVTSQEVLQIGSTGNAPRIHKFCEEALRSYIYWKFIQRRRGIPMNEKIVAKKEFYNQKRLARARMMSFNKSEALQTIRKSFKQSPKF